MVRLKNINRIIKQFIVIATFGIALFGYAMPVSAATSYCYVYDFGERSASECQKYASQPDTPCIFSAASGTSEGGYRQTTCYGTAYFTGCHYQKFDGTTTILTGCQRNSTPFPADCPATLSSNQTTCHMQQTASTAAPGDSESDGTNNPNDNKTVIGREKEQTCEGQTVDQCLEQSNIITLINKGINFLTAGVGIIITLALIFGGIRYATAGPDPAGVQAAKNIIFKAVIAFIAYIFLFAFLQWLVPGGFF